MGRTKKVTVATPDAVAILKEIVYRTPADHREGWYQRIRNLNSEVGDYKDGDIATRFWQEAMKEYTNSKCLPRPSTSSSLLYQWMRANDDDGSEVLRLAIRAWYRAAASRIPLNADPSVGASLNAELQDMQEEFGVDASAYQYAADAENGGRIGFRYRTI